MNIVENIFVGDNVAYNVNTQKSMDCTKKSTRKLLHLVCKIEYNPFG